MITREAWMDLKALARPGYNFSHIGAVVGLARRTVNKPRQTSPPPVSRRPPRPSTREALRTHYGVTGSDPIVPRGAPDPAAAASRGGPAALRNGPRATRPRRVAR